MRTLSAVPTTKSCIEIYLELGHLERLHCMYVRMSFNLMTVTYSTVASSNVKNNMFLVGCTVFWYQRLAVMLLSLLGIFSLKKTGTSWSKQW